MVFPREQLLGAITELDENHSGFVTCNDAVIRNVKAYQGTAQATQPVVGSSGIGVLWIENPGGGNPTLAKFTDSNNVTITLGQNLVTSVFGRTGDVVGASGDIANDSTIIGGTGTVTDALNALSSLGGENLSETLAIGNYTGAYDILIDNNQSISGRTSGSTFTMKTRDAATAASGALTVRTGDSPTTSSGALTIRTGDNAPTSSGALTLRSGTSTLGTGSVS